MMKVAGVVPTPVELTLDEVHQVAAGVAAALPSDYKYDQPSFV
jgi:hypothetical protein